MVRFPYITFRDEIGPGDLKRFYGGILAFSKVKKIKYTD